jgi:hypothetical protein
MRMDWEGKQMSDLTNTEILSIIAHNENLARKNVAIAYDHTWRQHSPATLPKPH